MNRECHQSYMKIFRPWTANRVGTQEQDATISTTSNPDDEKIHADSTETKSIPDQDLKPTKTEKVKSSQPPNKTLKQPSLPTVTTDWYNLSTTDALLLEAASLAHGLSHNTVADEYARVLLGEEQRSRLNAATRKQRPKKYKCPHCDVGFSNNGQLKGHIRIHTGERPFRCDVASCGKTFTRNEELTRHKRIHSGLRPFACTECGKRFGRKDHLKKHVRTHAQHRAAAAVAAVYGAVPMFPVLMPPPPHAMSFDPWTTHPAFLTQPPPHLPLTSTLYSY